jgi:CHAD domain-containing protein
MKHARQALAAAGTAMAGIGAVLLVRSARERRKGKAKKDASRKFRLGRKEPLPAGIVRIAAGRLDSAVDELSGRARDDTAKAVHEARKDIKKLRAVVRLVGADSSWNRRLRDTARRLAGRRDADVLLETLDALIESGAVTKKSVRGLRKELAREAKRSQDDRAAIELAHAELTVARYEVGALAPQKDSFKAVRPGLEKIYGDGRVAYRAARKKPTTANLHEWRKRAKDLWYSATVLRSAWPAMMSELAAETHVLTELLGEDHDLAMLAERATGKKHKQLRRAVAKRRARLQKHALKMGKRLYAEKPKSFSRRIGAAWQTSR